MSIAAFTAGFTAGIGVSATFLIFLVLLNLRARRKRREAFMRMYDDVEQEVRRYPPVPTHDLRQWTH